VSAPATTALHHHPAQDGGIAGVIATTLPIALVLAALVWLAKPWKRTKLPRARLIERRDDDIEEP
jgi:hypothetical protein